MSAFVGEVDEDADDWGSRLATAPRQYNSWTLGRIFVMILWRVSRLGRFTGNTGQSNWGPRGIRFSTWIFSIKFIRSFDNRRAWLDRLLLHRHRTSCWNSSDMEESMCCHHQPNHHHSKSTVQSDKIISQHVRKRTNLVHALVCRVAFATVLVTFVLFA